MTKFREDFCRRGRERSYHVDGPKTDCNYYLVEQVMIKINIHPRILPMLNKNRIQKAVAN